MNRRGFLGFLSGGIVASAAVRTFPFRVFSFPSTITIPQFDFAHWASIESLRVAMNKLSYSATWNYKEFEKPFPIDATIRIKRPKRYLNVPE
jgi:hypothetical protein